jgi:hypothetical protein
MLRIQAVLRLQDFTSNDSKAFVDRRRPAHSEARGAIGYYVVRGATWPDIRRTLREEGVVGVEMVNSETVQGFAQDSVKIRGARLLRLPSSEVPAPCIYDGPPPAKQPTPRLEYIARMVPA